MIFSDARIGNMIRIVGGGREQTRGSCLVAACIVWLSAFVSASSGASPKAVRIDEQHQLFFQEYCLACHHADQAEGQVRLDDLPLQISEVATAERWQKVLNALNAGEMPPADRPQPPGPAKAAFLEHLSKKMVEARNLLSDSGGTITIRRLNKREYEHTIRELLGGPVEVQDLPNDGGGGTLDTFGKALYFSSDQFEQYLAVARKALDNAIVSGPPVATRKERIEVEEEANRRITGILRGYQMGGFRAYRQWTAAKDRPPSDFGLVDEKEMEFRLRVWETNTPPMIDYLTREETRSGALLTIAEPNGQVGLGIPDEMPPGTYRLRARLGVLPRTPAERSFVEIGFRGKSLNDAIGLLDCRQVEGSLQQPQIIEWEIQLPALTRPLSEDIGSQTNKRILIGERVIALRERQFNSGEAANYRHRQSLTTTGFGIEPAIWVDWLEWEGPIYEDWPPPAHQSIFFAGPDAVRDERYARAILARFAKRAFRGRPVQPAYLNKLVRLYQEKLAAGESFEEALKEPLSAILASPSFLYLAEPTDGQASPHLLEPHELACRLSYFLWSSPPDGDLLKSAGRGDLRQPAILSQQTERMLASPKVARMISGFAHQWLQMERLDFFQFNYRLYPKFDDSIKRAARQEVFRTLSTILEEDLPAASLLKSDFVVINDLLAQYYGIDGIAGSEFRKVAVPPGLPRGGILGMAAILAMGSDGERSSPVERGAWLLRKLLDDPPPPAPANVPQLSRHGGKLLSARELLSAHMEEPQCAQCHAKIDPLGFGLENFDAVGLWRDKEYTELAARNIVKKFKEHPIDAHGRFPDGQEFQDFFELRELLAEREEVFVRGLCEQLLAYALGRPYTFQDEAIVAELMNQTKAKGYSLRALIQALITHPVFQYKS